MSRRISHRARIENLTELTKQLELLGKDPNREISRMRDRRAELASQLRSALKDDARYFSNVNRIKDRLTATVINIGDQLWPWSILELPTMAEKINQKPTASDTSGEVATAGLFQGSGAWGGTLEAPATEQQWWVHTWTCTAILPSAGSQGTVSYRFGANCEAMIYRTDGAVSLTSYHRGTTSDANTPITNWQTVGWPFNVLFTSPELAADMMFVPDSNFGMGLLGQSGYAAWGKIQYRFNPQWVIEGATEAIG